MVTEINNFLLQGFAIEYIATTMYHYKYGFSAPYTEQYI